jgi:hypothetical protein
MQRSWLVKGSANSTRRRLALVPNHFSLASSSALESRFLVLEHVRLCLLIALG